MSNTVENLYTSDRWLRARWDITCYRLAALEEDLLQCDECFPVFCAISAAYEEKHRHYHTTQHLRECFQILDDYPDSLDARAHALLECALWCHDVVYEVTPEANNEAASANWATAALIRLGVGGRDRGTVRDLILATRHITTAPSDPSLDLLLDVDLAILGAPPARFDEYEVQIRGEYRHVPEPLFRAGRAHVLEALGARTQLYRTEALLSRFERQARANLSRSLSALRA
jgi:predicted metal-dependent HD superfamily phosphohydrolase